VKVIASVVIYASQVKARKYQHKVTLQRANLKTENFQRFKEYICSLVHIRDIVDKGF
jgi:hypothetical protein